MSTAMGRPPGSERPSHRSTEIVRVPDDPAGQGYDGVIDLVNDHVLAHLDALQHRIAEDLPQRIAEVHPGFADRYPAWRGSQGRALMVIPGPGASLTEVAARIGVAKQTLAEPIRALVEVGLVETGPDPADGRIVIVRRTAEGDRVAADLHAAILAMQTAWAVEVGPRRLATFLAVADELGRGRREPDT